MENSNLKETLTYNDVIYLHTILNNINVNVIDKEIRADLYKFKKSLSDGITDFTEARTFVLLMNEGVEIKENGNSYYDEPKFQTRKEFAGSDEEYKLEYEKINKIRQKIKKEILSLGNSFSNVPVNRILTDEQFDKLLKEIKQLEFEGVRPLLVK